MLQHLCWMLSLMKLGLMRSSDGQEFAKPPGYAGKGAEGKGQGRDK